MAEFCQPAFPDMADDFDPYREWFGIAADSIPPDHYSLLGIDRFESEKVTIERAIEKRVEFLQDIAVGERTVESQRLLNEVAAARLCLLNENKKAEYDHELKHGKKVVESVPASSAASEKVDASINGDAK